jgi:hypothetical protein
MESCCEFYDEPPNSGARELVRPTAVKNVAE